MYIREEELLDLIHWQEEENRGKLRTNALEVLEEEFVMNSIFHKFLDYIKRYHTERDKIDIKEFAKKCDAPVKKIKDFNISRQDSTTIMYLHKHTYIEIDYVYKGSCNYHINSEENVLHLREKELCILNQNVIHGIQTLSDEDIVLKCMIPFDYIEVDQFKEINQDVLMKKFLLHALNENMTKASFIIFDMKGNEIIDTLICNMFYEYVKNDIGWGGAVKNFLSLLFIHLMRMKESDIRMFKEIEKENFNITKILNSIQKNYQYITLKDIAEDLHFHENYLSRMIKQNTKQNFRDLLCQIRLKEAENLLLYSDLSVTEIAGRVGYNKPNYFFKLFKDHYGITPIEFRTSGIVE